jgi:hypothetical protein
MIKSESIKLLAQALSKFQSEITNPKNSAVNPFFKSKYAPLSDVLTLIRPTLSKYGLSIVQPVFGDTNNISVTTILMHESGEFIESEPLVFKTEKATPQGAGSSITYARRYSISSILGISSEDDDDGNACEKPTVNKAPVKQEAPKSNTISQEQQQNIIKSAKDTTKALQILKKYGYNKSSEIKTSDYEVILKELGE